MTNQTTSSNVGTPGQNLNERIGGLTCEEFQDQLPDLLTVGGSAFSNHAHLTGCGNCAALVRDLQSIADAARELLPAHDPSPGLWEQIQSSMQREAQHPHDGKEAN